MGKTERINLLVSPEEKSKIESRAKKAGFTTSELVRQALARHDETIELEQLVEIAGELGGAVTRMGRKLDNALSRIDALQSQVADRDQLIADIKEELNATGERWPFGVTMGSAAAAGGNH